MVYHTIFFHLFSWFSHSAICRWNCHNCHAIPPWLPQHWLFPMWILISKWCKLSWAMDKLQWSFVVIVTLIEICPSFFSFCCYNVLFLILCSLFFVSLFTWLPVQANWILFSSIMNAIMHDHLSLSCFTFEWNCWKLFWDHVYFQLLTYAQNYLVWNFDKLISIWWRY